MQCEKGKLFKTTHEESSASRNPVFVPPPYSILQFNNANIICKDFSERNKMMPFYVVTAFLVCYNRKKHDGYMKESV